MCSSRFLLYLSIVQVLCNLAGVVLELLRLDEICVPLEVSLSTYFTILFFLMMCFNMDLSLRFSFVRMFRTVKHYLSESKKGFDLRLVRLVLDSVFRCCPGPPVNFRFRTNHDVRFDSSDFVST